MGDFAEATAAPRQTPARRPQRAPQSIGEDARFAWKAGCLLPARESPPLSALLLAPGKSIDLGAPGWDVPGGPRRRRSPRLEKGLKVAKDRDCEHERQHAYRA
jgi:hypothetical protein